MKKQASTARTKKPRKQHYPWGWNEKRVKEVIAHYDRQTEEEAVAEYEAAMKVAAQSLILVPTKLIPEIRRLIARRA